MFQQRTYRNWVEHKDLSRFTVKIEESDLLISADRPFKQEARDSLKRQRKIVWDYIRGNHQFANSLEPYSLKTPAADIIREMISAAASAGVGPMASIAGAVAEYVGKDLLQHSSEVIVENGGDIFMKTGRKRSVGIFAGNSPYTGKLALEITPSPDPWGICTSSGTVGPSLSFGKADAAVAVCNSAVLADAWATRLGNMVKSATDVEKTLDFVKGKAGVKGVVIIIGEKIGVWGDIILRRQ